MSSPALKSAAAEPQPQTVSAPPPPAPSAAKAPAPRRRLLLIAIALAALAVALYYGYHYVTLGRFQVSTDDAYVKADTSYLSNKVAGFVTETPLANNTPVKAGEVVLRLDGADYKLAVEQAKAKMATQQSALAVISSQKETQRAQIASATAQLDAATATEHNAILTQQRASQLVKSAAGNQQALDDATKARDAAIAGVAAAQANIDAAKAQLATLFANEAQAQSALGELQIALDKAQQDLASTEIKAPFDGVISNRAVAPGEFIGPGTNLMALVPVQDSFVTANFKETQLASLHPGQKAEVEIDSIKGEKFEGKLASLSPASGAEFSLLPPDNATGNFTKITQRFPVKILLPPEVSKRLRPGMSAVVTIDSRDKGDAKAN